MMIDYRKALQILIWNFRVGSFEIYLTKCGLLLAIYLELILNFELRNGY